jgi:hypothetical protein
MSYDTFYRAVKFFSGKERARETRLQEEGWRSSEANNAPIPTGRIVVPVRGLIRLVERCLRCLVALLGVFFGCHTCRVFVFFLSIRPGAERPAVRARKHMHSQDTAGRGCTVHDER